MIKPEDIKTLDLQKYNLDKIETAIDESIKQYHGWHPWEYALLDAEYPTTIRDELAKRYVNNGWKYVYHRTTSEDNQRPGLTSFMFSMVSLDEKYTKNYHYIH